MTCWKMMTSTHFTARGNTRNTFDFDHVIRLLYVYCNLIIHCMYIYIYIQYLYIGITRGIRIQLSKLELLDCRILEALQASKPKK